MTSLVRTLTAATILLTVFAAPHPAQAATHELGELVPYPLTFPVEGEHYFGDWFWAARSQGIHHAQDVMAPKMTPVVAAASGTVRLVNWTSQAHMNPDRCCTIALRHDDGWESWYIHLNNDTPGTDDGQAWGIAEGIAPGTHVEAGQLIGWVGDSGTAELTGPHLHFELRDPAGVIVNPFSALVDAGGTFIGDGPADPLFDGYRLIEDGTRGADVRRLQQVLTELGLAPGPVDGVAGPKTVAAVTSYQTAAGLRSDGIAGRVTRASLKAAYAERVGDGDSSAGAGPSGILRIGARGDTVKRLQSALAEAGYQPGPIDGIFGNRTELAVITFQDDHGLRVDGLVGPNTRSALGI
jgi:peptidoglycan hydrolase-like protein with peptidoglycan-binding domain